MGLRLAEGIDLDREDVDFARALDMNGVGRLLRLGHLVRHENRLVPPSSSRPLLDAILAQIAR